jgi:Mn-dependent DtxR family transcriptional regulator
LAAKFTYKQGQYLAFIYMYTKLYKRQPAEMDLQRHFQVTPPSVHQMTLTLEARGLISRIPWTPRSLQVLVPREELPELD